MKKLIGSVVISGLAMATLTGMGMIPFIGGLAHADDPSELREATTTEANLPDDIYNGPSVGANQLDVEEGGFSKSAEGTAKVAVVAENEIPDDIFGGPSLRVNIKIGADDAVDFPDDIWGGPSTKVIARTPEEAQAPQTTQDFGLVEDSPDDIWGGPSTEVAR